MRKSKIEERESEADGKEECAETREGPEWGGDGREQHGFAEVPGDCVPAVPEERENSRPELETTLV